MENIDLFKYYQSMTEDSFTMAFKGEISHELVVCLGESLKQKLTSETHRKVIRKVFAVFIEMAQNVYKYSADKITLDGREIGTGILSLQESRDFFKVLSGNLVRNEEVTGIMENCTKINSLNKEGLRKYYKEVIKEPRANEQTGGGIGLIEIARKASNPLEIEMYKVDDSHSFFAFSVKVNKEET